MPTMPRLPFDPADVPPDKEKPKPARRERKQYGNIAEANHITVSQATELIKATLENRIPSPLRVIGQVSNLKSRNHWYFSLKDDAAVLDCVAWASSAKKFKFTPSDGDEVVATGHISHYPPQGRTQMYVTGLKPVGAGALEIEFRKLCEELRGLGYFDPSHKKPLPLFPRRIAVITSRDSAAAADVLNTASRRCAAVGLLMIDVRVQGESAKEQVARAVRWVNKHHDRLGVDAMLITRGGGSMEDLWAFNERIVADAVFKSSLPVVAAIGHESDTTVVELVADVRAATPTQAVMLAIPDAAELIRQVDHLSGRLRLMTNRIYENAAQRSTTAGRDFRRSLRHRLQRERSRIDRAAAQLAALAPQVMISKRHERVAVAADRLDRAIRRRVDQRPHIKQLRLNLHRASMRHIQRLRERVDAWDHRLEAIDPRRVLRRGYSMTELADGSLLRSVAQIKTGAGLKTHLVDGVIDSVVGGSAPRKRRSRKGKSSEADSQMDLFEDAG